MSNKRLGNITELDSARIARDENVTQRYRLLDVARELLPDYRVSRCLHIPIPGKSIEIWQETKTAHAHLQGVGRCGSGWVCPVCASKIAMGRAAEIQEAIEKAKERGLSIIFVTLTARHSRGDTLSDNLAGLKNTLRFMRKGRAWGNLRRDLGIIGQVDGVEVTWGFSAGWHPHFHTAYFVQKSPDVTLLEGEIFKQWENALSKYGFTCEREYGVKVLLGGEYLSDYMAKWGLKTELTSREKSGRQGNYSPFQLLALYEAGEHWAGGLYQEYAEATKGLSLMRWGRGLRDDLGMGEEVNDQELAEAEVTEGAVKLATLAYNDFRRLIYSGRRGVIGELLTIAERGPGALWIWLGLFGIVPPE